MIVLGADAHKRSHTITAVPASTGRVLGDRTAAAAARGFGHLLKWARGLGRERVWAWGTAGMCAVAWSGF